MKYIFIWWVFLLSSQIENFLLSENVNYGISLCHRQQWIFPSSEARGEIVLWKSKSRHCCRPKGKNWLLIECELQRKQEHLEKYKPYTIRVYTGLCVHIVYICIYRIYIGYRYQSWWENAHLFLAFCPLFFACSRLKCIIKLHAVIPFWLRFPRGGGWRGDWGVAQFAISLAAERRV